MRARTLNFLLVEDDVVDRKAFARAMNALPSQTRIVCAEDGVEALEVLRHRDPQRALARPHIVVLDLNMPRMGGFEFLAQLRADPELRDTVVLVLTTSDAARDIEQAYSHHVAGYFLKQDLTTSFAEAIETLDRYWRLVEFPAT